MSTDLLIDEIEQLPLVDHHVHGALRDEVDRAALEQLLTESDRPVPTWMTQFDSQLGFAVRRWCAPVLGLAPHADPGAYLARRRELGTDEVNRRLLRASGVGRYLLETGYKGEDILDVPGMATVSGRRVDEVVRLETVLEDVVRAGVTAAALPDRFRETLAARTATAVGLKSIIAYRYGFDFDPGRPHDVEVAAAADTWFAACEDTGTIRVDDPVLLRFILWCGVDRGLPIQLHAGYGDPDVELHRCDPLLLTRFIKNVEPHGTDLLLLHCYPFQRNAGYLAQVFPHVYFDVGLGVNYTGARSDAVIAESLELAPFAKILFSSDAWGPPELHYLGALLWRRGMGRALTRWTDSGEWDVADARRVVRMIGHDNACRVYGLETPE
ncbi:amidohydrolase family protein [Streptomyces spirodelae]|uniref:Amidohydrolase family protein n=1 Tax=Streptomyces spirodelae TaxID=2812904 RepID=A0ABS3WQA1_9ACTN|nr:amidohydrolase family protein [Streptomyces spirodelae]MBO8185290.1 amidohydrolase family protein [Streptomyces spirodelae]